MNSTLFYSAQSVRYRTDMDFVYPGIPLNEVVMRLFYFSAQVAGDQEWRSCHCS
uniref:Uncharacterized protein n=1 Tax=Candidatus Nitrotoga fabula TaxID=2182327 RepID=A0A2X0QTP3_9PROT|nr:protein of unknown function [Candidatus Nitrotoga fabula]